MILSQAVSVSQNTLERAKVYGNKGTQSPTAITGTKRRRKQYGGLRVETGQDLKNCACVLPVTLQGGVRMGVVTGVVDKRLFQRPGFKIDCSNDPETLA